MENKEKIDLDILKHVEKLSNQINNMMQLRTKSVFEKYPMTFALLVLMGVVAIHDGVKGILMDFGFAEHNWYLLLAGLIILTTTGTLYKKLDK